MHRALEALDQYALAINQLDEVMSVRAGLSVPNPRTGRTMMGRGEPVGPYARSGDTLMGQGDLVPPVGGRANPAGVMDVPMTPVETLPLSDVEAAVAPFKATPLKTEGAYYELARDVDIAMAVDDAARARYEQIYGKPWEPNWDILQRGAMNDADVAALGGVVSETSEAGTRAGKAKARKPAAPEPEPVAGPRTEASPTAQLPSPEYATAPMGAATGEVRAGRTALDEVAGPVGRRSPLEAFAYDVQAAAGRLGPEPTIREIFDAIKAQRGRAPFSPARFHELVGEAEIAGYLATTGERKALAHLGEIGDRLSVRPEFQAGDPVKFSFRDRFDRFEDRGRWGNDTRREFQVEGNLAHGPVEPPRGGVPSEVSIAEHPAVDASAGPRTERINERGKTERTPANEGALEEALRKAEEGRATDLDVPRQEPVAADGSVFDDGGRMDAVLRRFEADAQGPAIAAGERAAESVRAALDALSDLSGGKLGSVEAREAALAAGLRDVPRSVLGNQLANLWGIRQLGRAAAEGAKAGGRRLPKGSILERMARSAGGGGLRRAVAGGSVMAGMAGGAAGAIGGHLAGAMIGAAGTLGASVGRARDMILKAGDALLRGRGSRVLAAVPVAARYSYDGSEPTDDVPTRITQIQTALENPEATRQRILKGLGDLAVTQPDMANMVADDGLRKLANLRMRAPMFVWDAMGNARPAGAQALRRFREYEDATWNLPRLLDAVAGGYITQAQADAFREQHPQAHGQMLMRLMADPAVLQRVSRERQRVVEMLSGVPLHIGGPQYAIRQQAAFVVQPAQPPQGQNPGAVKAPVPTPAQAQIAPGNN